MKILFIVAPFPYPPDTGSRKLISDWLDAACRKHGVDLIAIDERGGTARAIPELPGVCSELLPVSVGKSIVARLTRFVASFGRGIPATSLVYVPCDVEQRVRKHVGAQSYDAAVLTENDVAGFATLLASSVPLVLFKHSVQAADARDARLRHGLGAPRWMLAEWIVRRFRLGRRGIDRLEGWPRVAKPPAYCFMRSTSPNSHKSALTRI